MNKTCSGCKQIKPIDDFAFANKANNVRGKHCSACRTKIRSKYYQKNKDRHKQKVKNWKQSNSVRFQEWKLCISCIACGENENCCIDFHHLDPSSKEFTIGEHVYTKSWKVIQKEVEKCVPLCRNCHCKLHAGILDINNYVT